MVLLPMMSTAKEALSSTLVGRLLGPALSSKKSPKDEVSNEPLPPLKYKVGEEPTTPRVGSPGFQDGHWVRVHGVHCRLLLLFGGLVIQYHLSGSGSCTFDIVYKWSCIFVST